jgi:hypothetical protein
MEGQRPRSSLGDQLNATWSGSPSDQWKHIVVTLATMVEGVTTQGERNARSQSVVTGLDRQRRPPLVGAEHTRQVCPRNAFIVSTPTRLGKRRPIEGPSTPIHKAGMLTGTPEMVVIRPGIKIYPPWVLRGGPANRDTMLRVASSIKSGKNAVTGRKY